MKKLLLFRPIYIIWSAVLACLFGVMIPVGRAFRNGNSIKEAFSVKENIVSGVIMAVVLFIVLVIVFRIMDIIYEKDLIHTGWRAGRDGQIERGVTTEKADRLNLFFGKYWWIVWAVLAAAGLVILFFIRPGILMGDTASQIAEAFNHPAYYFKAGLNYEYADSFLTNMHPVLVTYAIKLCMLIGYYLFGSYCTGLTLCTALQLIVLTFSAAYSCNVLSRLKIRGFVILIALLLTLINPLVLNSAFVLAKDVIYSSSLFVMAMAVLLYMKNKAGTADKILIPAAAFAASAFRGEGKYIAAITMLLVLLIFIKRKAVTKRKLSYLLSISAGIILLSILWVNIALPLLHVTGSLRSYKYTMAMQQTARYVLAHEDELTDAEKEALSKVVNLEELKENYDPVSADEVKSVFNNNASDEELDGFIKTWLKFVAKDPVLAFKTWLNNKYEYFYLENTQFNTYKFKKSQSHMTWLNEQFSAAGQDLALGYPEEYSGVRSALESFINTVKEAPVLNILVLPAIYILIFIVLAVFAFTKRNADGIIMMFVPFGTLITTNMFGATNGSYGRYLLPLVLMINFMIAVALKKNNSGNLSGNAGGLSINADKARIN